MTLWGGRFAQGPDDALWRFTVDHSDRRLLSDDVRGSLAHAQMLGEAGLLTDEEAAAVREGLETILAEAEAGEFRFTEQDEDVHSAVERRLGELIGPAAGKLHTGRSRNDQVSLDLRLYLRRAADRQSERLADFIRVVAEAAEGAGETVVAGYTHLQQGQAVPLAHHLLAYAWMAVRDRERFRQARARMDVSPLGAGALGGSGLPLNPARTAELLGMGAAFDNSMDAVGSRDFAAEYAFVCAQALAHLSRLAEECVLWASSEFGWATFPDSLTTGSSALPHKKNPDIAELTRARSAGAIGHLTGLMALQKGLPLTYNRDLQEDKRMVLAVDDLLAGALEAMSALLSGAEFHPPRPDSWVAALDLAEALVERGVPFREAHRAVGELVAALLDEGRNLGQANASDLAAAHPAFRESDLGRMDPFVSVARRPAPGAASHASVRAQLKTLRNLLV